MFGGGVWGTRLGSDVPQNAARTKHVPHKLNPARFGGRFGDAAGDALKAAITTYSLPP